MERNSAKMSALQVLLRDLEMFYTDKAVHFFGEHRRLFLLTGWTEQIFWNLKLGKFLTLLFSYLSLMKKV